MGQYEKEGGSSLSDFNQLSKLGEGSFAVVYKVLRHADRGIYALKMVKLPSLKEKEKQNALNEVRLLASVQHENIIAYKEAFF
jgi:NIMA (never in mitosis gene a)-related kinase